MTHSKGGIYAPRFTDVMFSVMGLGSTVALIFASSAPVKEPATTGPSPFSGVMLTGAAVLIALLSCFVHKRDRKGWDDYMFQIVTQSALIGMISLLITGTAIDIVLSPWLGVSHSHQLGLSMVPIASMSWAIDYFYLRLRGTAE